jgi:predicted MFS family arabinose efflux permease
MVALAGFCSGTVWSTDMSTRRRMVGEAAAPQFLARVIALDSLAGALTRMLGPLAGAAAYGWVGLSGAYAMSTALTLGSLALVPPIANRQVTKKLSFTRLPRELAEGMSTARRDPVVRAVLGVTVAMNLFGYSYSALVAPIARLVFEVPTALVGVLAAAEPFGALIGGTIIAVFAPPLSQRVLFLGGGGLFLVMVAVMPAASAYALACAIMVVGGIGTSGFSNMQTTLVLTGAAPAVRSRLLGLITVCIGTGPIGLLLTGALSDSFGPLAAMRGMGLAGLAVLLAVGWDWVRTDRSR